MITKIFFFRFFGFFLFYLGNNKTKKKLFFCFYIYTIENIRSRTETIPIKSETLNLSSSAFFTFKNYY